MWDNQNSKILKSGTIGNKPSIINRFLTKKMHFKDLVT